jgi:hypothetical protein
MVGSSTAMGGPCAHKGTEGRNGGGGGEMVDAVGWCHGGPAPARWRGGKEDTPWTGRELPALPCALAAVAVEQGGRRAVAARKN